jgi:hypothetical protein
MDFASESSKMRDGQTSKPQPAPTIREIVYDEFAIGWNEMFDTTLEEDGHAGSVQQQAPPARAAPGERGSAGAPAPGKAMPEYLRLGSRRLKQSEIISRNIKEYYSKFDHHQFRKPAEFMERDMDQLRAELTKTARAKRVEMRKMRRLQRRCRVKEDEDLDQLKEIYITSEFLKPVRSPADSSDTRTLDTCQRRSLKEYFALATTGRGSKLGLASLVKDSSFEHTGSQFFPRGRERLRINSPRLAMAGGKVLSGE